MTEWISVKDRLPDDPMEEVIAWTGEEAFIASCVGTDWAECYLYDSIEVTHWMPLPQPPKGE